MVLTFFCFFSSKHVRDFTAMRAKNDLGFLKFDIETDLEPLFNWNVKQLFLFLTAEYETKDNVSIFLVFVSLRMSRSKIGSHIFQETFKAPQL